MILALALAWLAGTLWLAATFPLPRFALARRHGWSMVTGIWLTIVVWPLVTAAVGLAILGRALHERCHRRRG